MQERNDRLEAEQQRRLWRTAVRAVRCINQRLPTSEKMGRETRRSFASALLLQMYNYEAEAEQVDPQRQATTKCLKHLRRARSADQVKPWRTARLEASVFSLPGDCRLELAETLYHHGLLEYRPEDEGRTIYNDARKVLEKALRSASNLLPMYAVAADAAELALWSRQRSWRSDYKIRLVRGLFEVFHQYTGRNCGRLDQSDPEHVRGGSLFYGSVVLPVCGSSAFAGEQLGVRPRFSDSTDQRQAANAVMHVMQEAFCWPTPAARLAKTE